MFTRLSSLFAWMASVLGVLGISAAHLFADSYKSHIALGIFATTCAIMSGYVIWSVRSLQLKHYPKGYIPVATFVRYTTTDGKQIVYEAFRQIQVKHAFLTEIEHRYSWSGTKRPTITSTLQTIGPTAKDEKTGWDVVPVKFRHPRYYNDTEIVHLRSTLDDSDEKSETYCNIRIDHPTRMLQFRIELLHCSKPNHGNMIAHIERRLETLSAASEPWEPIDKIQFNVTSRSFEHLIADPNPGYQYRIRWDRPIVNGRKLARN